MLVISFKIVFSIKIMKLFENWKNLEGSFGLKKFGILAKLKMKVKFNELIGV